MRAIRHEPPPLSEAPATLADTRRDLHRLVVYAVSPARESVTGRMALRASDSGFGTPPFGDDETQVMVVGDEIVRTSTDRSERKAITTLSETADFLGLEIDTTRSERYDVPPAGDVHEKLAVDAEASRWLAGWFAFGDSVLEGMRAGFNADEGVGIAQLWPEHFDLAIDGGAEERGQRVNYGFSPGDEHMTEPYLYVGPWNTEGLDDPYWGGATWAPRPLSYLLETADPRASALEFLREGRDLLRSRVRRMGHL